MYDFSIHGYLKLSFYTVFSEMKIKNRIRWNNFPHSKCHNIYLNNFVNKNNFPEEAVSG